MSNTGVNGKPKSHKIMYGMRRKIRNAQIRNRQRQIWKEIDEGKSRQPTTIVYKFLPSLIPQNKDVANVKNP